MFEMTQDVTFQKGDLVVHANRPEWGDGQVTEARSINHAGQNVQRLIVNFANRGRVTLMTGSAPLVHKDQAAPTPAAASASPGQSSAGWLGALEEKQNGGSLTDLPEALTDPFLSLSRRLRATLDAFRFSQEPRSLIDWAVAQTGLNDPLTRYSRPELEQAFPGYAHAREANLRDLVRQMKRQGELGQLNKVLSEIRNPAAAQALNRAMKA